MLKGMDNKNTFITIYIKIALLDYPICVNKITDEEYQSLLTEYKLSEVNQQFYMLLSTMFPDLKRSDFLVYYVRHGSDYLKYYDIAFGALELVDLTS